MPARPVPEPSRPAGREIPARVPEAGGTVALPSAPFSGATALALSTYDLGRRPAALAELATALRATGWQVRLADLAVDPWDDASLAGVDLVVWSLPLHTATRLMAPMVPQIRALAPRARLMAVGLYAVLNRSVLAEAGVEVSDHGTGIGVAARRTLRSTPPMAGLDGQPAAEGAGVWRSSRDGLPPLDRYARLVLADGTERLVGATAASVGCRHLCRHCPIVPVYSGRFRAVAVERVLAEVAGLVACGAGHVSFTDPDFLNGPAHARRVARAMHERFPQLSFDLTARISHLRDHRHLLAELRDAGCVLITSAVESFDPLTLQRLDKGHTAEDVEVVVAACRHAGIGLEATFVAFTPWTSVESYRQFLDRVDALGLAGSVAPVQYGVRLLVGARSALLDLPEIAASVGEFDPELLVHPWSHTNPYVDELYRRVSAVVRETARSPAGPAERQAVHARLRALVGSAAPRPANTHVEAAPQPATIAWLTEPWFC